VGPAAAEGLSAPHVEKAIAYARDVVAGATPACRWVRLACQRQLDDLARPRGPDWRYSFDPERAERVCFTVELLPHVKGKWARDRQTIVLEPWQCFILTTVFGWVDDAGLRRFRTVYIEVPRKNSKSTLSAAVALYCLAFDGEEGAECYSAATTRDQAAISWKMAKRMVQLSPGFRSAAGALALAHSIAIEATGSSFQALSSDAHTLDGLNVHMALVDEVHAHRTRDVVDVLDTATGSREQPLIWMITTAGIDFAGVCYEQHNYIEKVLGGEFTDERFFGVIYGTDDGDEWSSPATWQKANPNLGVSVFEDDLERQAVKARQSPASQATFLTKRLDVWVSSYSPWMDMSAWRRCGDEALTLAEFEGESCVVTLDIANRQDIAAEVQLFRRDEQAVEHWYAFGRWYLPQEAVEQDRHAHFRAWARQGRVVVTPGSMTDQRAIQEHVCGLPSRFDVCRVGYDPHDASKLAVELADDGFEVVEVRPTVLNFSEPMKLLLQLVKEGRFHHDGDPVLTWMASNVVAHLDAKDNVYPRKQRDENKIDGIVAIIMGLRCWPGDQRRSVYEYDDADWSRDGGATAPSGRRSVYDSEEWQE